MKADHTVKIDGKWYRVGDELPSPNTPIIKEVPKKSEYNKSRILFMKASELRELAMKEGVTDEPLNSTIKELKEMLIEHFGL